MLRAGPMNSCNSAYSQYQSSDASADYDTLVSDCQGASSAMGPVQTLLNNAGGASTGASGISALSAALTGLPSQTVSTQQER